MLSAPAVREANCSGANRAKVRDTEDYVVRLLGLHPEPHTQLQRKATSLAPHSWQQKRRKAPWGSCGVFFLCKGQKGSSEFALPPCLETSLGCLQCLEQVPPCETQDDLQGTCTDHKPFETNISIEFGELSYPPLSIPHFPRHDLWGAMDVLNLGYKRMRKPLGRALASRMGIVLTFFSTLRVRSFPGVMDSW